MGFAKFVALAETRSINYGVGCWQTNLAKVHRLDTFASQGRSDGRTGACLARLDDELDDRLERFGLGHGCDWPTCTLAKGCAVGCGSILLELLMSRA
jgi:hypothetical protein